MIFRQHRSFAYIFEAGIIVLLVLFFSAVIRPPATYASPNYRILEKKCILVSDAGYNWGYLGGLKQPLGAYKDGYSIQQTIKPIYVDADPESPSPPVWHGIANHVIWVDENGHISSGILNAMPEVNVEQIRPSGMVAFVPGGGGVSEGSILLTFGGKSGETIDLCLDKSPLDLQRDSFEYIGSGLQQFDNFIPSGDDNMDASSGICLHTTDSKVIFVWRNGGSTDAGVTVRCRVYDNTNIFGSFPDSTQFDVMDLGCGEDDASDYSDTGIIGVEQVWTKYDPRFKYLLATWQYFVKRVDYHVPPSAPGTRNYFGSCPFLYSDDNGATWRDTRGVDLNPGPPHPPQPILPLRYSEIRASSNNVLIPDDHLADDRHFPMINSDIGVFGDPEKAESITFWMVLPEGDNPWDDNYSHFSRINFWYFDRSRESAAWASTTISDELVVDKSYAVGTTRDYLVFVYADIENGEVNVLKAKISKDGGQTWSAPFILDTVEGEGDEVISWVSFAQPAENYTDNCVRFFYTYTDEPNMSSFRYRNNIKWIKFRIAELGE